MPQRDDIMASFGPILLESVALVVLDQINLIRQELSLPQRTKQQLLDEISNHLSTLPQYDWMLEQDRDFL